MIAIFRRAGLRGVLDPTGGGWVGGGEALPTGFLYERQCCAQEREEDKRTRPEREREMMRHDGVADCRVGDQGPRSAR